MLTVFLPNNNIPERKYIIKCIFSHFLGLDYNLVFGDYNSSVIAFNDKEIVVSDTFWRGEEELAYLSINNLPKLCFYQGSFSKEDNLPVLYGSAKVDVMQNRIYCGIDIFSSVFFMLSRWEEYVVNKRDEHGRFIGKESVAYKYDLLRRPVVNEYIEFLWNMMYALGFKGNRKEKTFELVLTHDIDYPYMRFRPLRVTKYIIKRMLEGHFVDAITYLPYFFYDPYNVFDFFMNESESYGAKSHFYFMSASPDEKVNLPSPYFSNVYLSIVNRIIKRGHLVGFHPGYSSTLNKDNWAQEKKRLEDFLNVKVCEGRQHYLRMDIPNTFTLWESNNMGMDSTLGYHDVEGFRCGTGDVFPIFNFLERKEYHLLERPLIIMDVTLISYQGYSDNHIKEILNHYILMGKQYNMVVTFIFHNSSFLGMKGRRLKRIYKQTIDNIVAKTM